MINTKITKTLESIASALTPFAAARIAAAIVYKNDIISVGYNQKKSHPFQRKFARHADCIFLHAETDAIKNTLKLYDPDILSKSTLYVSRVRCVSSFDKSLILGLARPCSGCQRAIATFDIKNVIYSNNENGYETL
jgi:deoxycytidylate deaminase